MAVSRLIRFTRGVGLKILVREEIQEYNQANIISFSGRRPHPRVMVGPLFPTDQAILGNLESV